MPDVTIFDGEPDQPYTTLGPIEFVLGGRHSFAAPTDDEAISRLRGEARGLGANAVIRTTLDRSYLKAVAASWGAGKLGSVRSWKPLHVTATAVRLDSAALPGEVIPLGTEQLDHLERLVRLRDQGVLTEEDFEKQRAMVVHRGPEVRSRQSPEERRQILADAIAARLAQGRRVESQTDYHATLVWGHRRNDVLHLLLTVFTLGLWVLVWGVMGAAVREHREMVSVDEWGHISVREL